MKNKYILLVILWTFRLPQRVVGANSTLPYDPMRCKEHTCLKGYSYDTFYEVFDDDDIHRTQDIAFEMHFAILASSNGHVVLSSSAYPDPDDPVYEIVVGGGGNKFSELRRNLRRNAKISVKSDGILSPTEYRPFYVRVARDGIIEFGKEGDKLALLSYLDVDPIDIKFFSFAAWAGVEAKFLYDCPAPDSDPTKTIAPDSKTVLPKLTPAESLKQTLIMDRSPSLPPAAEMEIKMDININSVKYNAYDGKLIIGIAMLVEWTDNSMAWYPDKFNGTKLLKFRKGEIWSPSFFVLDSDSTDPLDSKNTELITMASSGVASYHLQATIQSWCYNEAHENLTKKWPNDEVICQISLTAWQPHEVLTLAQYDGDDDKLKVFADLDKLVNNEWDLNLSLYIIPSTAWNDYFYFTPIDEDMHRSDKVLINLYLKRQSAAYNIVFYTPLVVLVTFVLLSFWDEPLQMSRVWYYAAYSVAICAGLCYVNYLVPCHTVPSIIILYTTVLMGVLVALLIQVLLMMPLAERFSKSLAVQSLLGVKWFRTIFCLPLLKTCRNYDSINEAYTSQEDDDSSVIDVPRNGPIEEMQSEASKYGEKEELAEVVDRLMFVIYSVTFVVMLACHY